MPLKKLVSLILTICFSAASVALIVAHSRPRSTDRARGASTDAGAYAYITSDELLLMRGVQIITRIQRDYVPADPYVNHVVWTHSGRYVVTLSTGLLRESDFSTQDLVFIEVRTGKVGRIACPRCSDLVAIGANGILATAGKAGADTGREYLKFSLDSPNPETPPHIILGDGKEGLLVGTEGSVLGDGKEGLLYGAEGSVLTQQSAFVGSSYQRIFLRDLVVAAEVNYRYFESNEYVRAVVDEASSAEGTRIALALNPNAGECVAASPIKLLTSGGTIIDTDMRAALPPGYVPGVQSGLRVNDLWWGSDGNLHASVTSWTCDSRKRSEDEKQSIVRSGSVFRLDGEKWVMDGTDRATMMRYVDDGSRIALAIPDCIGRITQPNPATYCNTGTLYRDQSGKRTKIADGVISIFAPPPRPATKPSSPYPAGPSDLSSLIAPMVGTWNVHGERLVIRHDGAGTLLWNAGPCEDPFQNPKTLTCTGQVALTFSTRNGIIVGRYGTVVYRDSNNIVIPDYDASDDDIKSGGTFTLVQVAQGVLRETTNNRGSHYWCSSAAAEPWHSKCNA